MKQRFLIAGVALLGWTGLAQDPPVKDDAKVPGNATEAHSDGLHGYIGFSHEQPPPQSAYSAGMGFYAAVQAG